MGNIPTDQKPDKDNIQWVTPKEWQDLRDAGLLFFANQMLHAFGWAIVVEVDDETKLITKAYPARVKFRGFDDASQTEEHIKIANYLFETSAELKQEAELP